MKGEDVPPQAARPPRAPDPPDEGQGRDRQQTMDNALEVPDGSFQSPQAGVWSPQGTAKVLATLADGSEEQSRQRRLYAVSTANYPLHADTALRAMTADETAAMQAYVTRKLELPAPPTFLSCTTTGFKRAALLAFHQEHIEGTLIAKVPATVRLGEHIPRQSLLRELVEGNAHDDAGKARLKRFIKAAQRITFDGEHTLSVVFMSHKSAAQWNGERFRLRGSQIQLNVIGRKVPGVRSPPEVARHYAIRVLGTTGLNPMQLLQVFGDIAQEPPLDVRHPGPNGLKQPDNDYWTILFASQKCPPALQGVSAVVAEDKMIILHHFRRTQHPPCRRCLNPKHLSNRCRVTELRLASTRALRQREYVGQSGALLERLPDWQI